MLTYRALHGQAPAYIADLVKWYKPGRTLRSSNQGLLETPPTTFATRGDRAFQAVAPRLWNALPQDLKNAGSVGIFKTQLKTILFTYVTVPE